MSDENFTLQSKLSTTAAARKLDLPAKTVFSFLQDKGWIERVGDHWRLTGKGEFEGGEYIHSSKYGEYIGWPDTIIEHGIFYELLELPITSRQIGQHCRISAHRCNALFAELGWQKRYHRGWIITDAGRELGGTEKEDPESGVPFTVWPRSVLDNQRLTLAMTRLHANTVEHNEIRSATADESSAAAQPQQALDFDTSTDTAAPYPTMDGHTVDHIEDAAVDDWLYLMRVLHAYQRELPEAALGHSDFYLPAANLYIECWHARDKASAQASKLERLNYYREQTLPYIEISADDMQTLDSVLPRRLLRHGITVF